jgi:putative transposase
MIQRSDGNQLHRRSIRLKEYDYGLPGAYFVTICTHRRECLFGEIVEGKMHLSKAGMVLQGIWEKLPQRYLNTGINVAMIMPNHFHGIITIDVGAIHESPLRMPMVTTSRRKMLLSKMVRYFKMNSAKQINYLRGTPGQPVWQRNYYEHVIRNEIDLQETREYIQNNPLKWPEDENHPDHMRRRGDS